MAERYQVLDQLSLLVDKSLVVAESTADGTRYRLLETVRQYGLEKLGESGEADAVRVRHRDHYAALTAALDGSGRSAQGQPRLDDVELEIDNLRAAFEWSRDSEDIAAAATMVSSLQPLWLKCGRIRDLNLARQVDDPVLLARALTACGFVAGNSDNPGWLTSTSRRASRLRGRRTTSGGWARFSLGKAKRRAWPEIP